MLFVQRLNPFTALTSSVLSGQTSQDGNPKDDQTIATTEVMSTQNNTTINAEDSKQTLQNGSSEIALQDINLNEDDKKESISEDILLNTNCTNNNTNSHDTNQKPTNPIDIKPTDNTSLKTPESNLSSSPNKFRQLFIDTPTSMVSSIITTVPGNTQFLPNSLISHCLYYQQ